MQLMMDCVVGDLIDSIAKQNLCTSNCCLERCNTVSKLNVFNNSSSWKNILLFQNTLLLNNDPLTANSRIDGLCNLAKFAWKILYKIDLQFQPLQYKMDINFFGKNFCKIINKILSDLNLVSFQQEKVLQVHN